MYITGSGGTLRTGGRVSARLGKWTLEGKTDDWEVGAEVDWCNPVWCAGAGPHELRLRLVNGAWLWRDVQVRILDEGRGGVAVIGKSRWTLIGQ